MKQFPVAVKIKLAWAFDFFLGTWDYFSRLVKIPTQKKKKKALYQYSSELFFLYKSLHKY